LNKIDEKWFHFIIFLSHLSSLISSNIIISSTFSHLIIWFLIDVLVATDPTTKDDCLGLRKRWWYRYLLQIISSFTIYHISYLSHLEVISFILNYALYGNDGKIESDVLSQNQNMNRRNNHFRQWLRWEMDDGCWYEMVDEIFIILSHLIIYHLIFLTFSLSPQLDFWLIIIFQFGFIIQTIQIQIMIKFYKDMVKYDHKIIIFNKNK